MTPRSLDALLADVTRLTPLQVPELGTAAARDVTAIAYDSRAVTPGAVFVALRGAQREGTTYAAQAIEKGAIAIVAEGAAEGDPGVPWIVAERGRVALGALAATFYRHPSERLLLVGVTGTNGKTTSTYLLEGVFNACGWTSGRIGTTGYRVGSRERSSARTTPEAPDLQALLREMVDADCHACAMEVSSHALDLERVAFTRFGAAIFTNLTRDHLDYHGDMESYFAAKRRLFEMLPPEAPSAINVDDPRGDRLLEIARRPVTYALTREADVSPTSLNLTLDGIDAELRTPAGSMRLRMRLPGRPNAYNALGVVAACIGLEVPLASIADGLAGVTAVPGRFELVSRGQDDISVIVDYAHTDDALKNLLETARALAPQRIVTVFGCGGDRDRSKRPLMGAVAARLSDLVILTSDNPRSEDPAAIIEDIKRGLVQPERPTRHAGQTVASVQSTPWLAIVDREEAITRAVVDAMPGDLVLIAGKGHEATQTIGDRVLPFEDVAVAHGAATTIGGRAMSAEPFALSAREMAAAFGGVLVHGPADRALPTVSIDTRTLVPGDLYVALRGPRFDGHAFVAQAIAGGAAAVVVSDRAAVTSTDLPVIVVEDTLYGLQEAARVIRRRAGSTVVAITGSAGKTTTKEITATLLAGRFTTFRNRGNLNNHVGLPLSLFELRTAPQFAVMELGMSGVGEISRLVSIAEPQVRVWTNVGEAHIGFFSSIDHIALAKQEILEGAGSRDVFVANAADPRVISRAAGFAGEVVTFGVGMPADVTIDAVEPRGLDGTAATLSLRGDVHRIETRLLGSGNLANIAAASAVAMVAGISPGEIVAGVAALAPASHRGEIVRAQGGWVVIDDAYNSSPSALTRALQTLATLPGRHVAMLGEMLELGDFSTHYHAECGKAAADLGVSVIVSVGGEAARALADAARQAGAAEVHHVADSEAASALGRSLVREGDAVLVKGSRGIRMEAVVQALTEGAR